MPKDELFSFSVLVGHVPLPELHRDNTTFIEADLFGPHSKKEVRIDLVDGEKERQEFPVLPYEIDIKLFPTSKSSAWAFVQIDGLNACKILIHPGSTKTVHGFKTGSIIREFLFSLPRFGANKNDRIETSRHKAVGTVEVVMKEAIYEETIERFYHNSDEDVKPKIGKLEFTQATKEDSQLITKGQYLMLTTKPGSSVQFWNRKRRHGRYSFDRFGVGKILATLNVKYEIKGTLTQVETIII